MRINTNIFSLTAQRHLQNTQKAMSRALERLSSGRRINRAGDDAAGLGIAEGLSSQVRGLKQTIRNLNDAYGYLNTADGSLGIQMDIVQRMRELALQAANGTYSLDDRTFLNNEFQVLLDEFDRIASQTEFNGVKLLDGSFETRSLQVGVNKGETIDLAATASRAADIFTRSVNSGTFSARTTSLIASGPKDLAYGDFNGDGIQDIASASYSGVVSISIGEGDGTFNLESTIAAGSQPLAMTVADLNGDGNQDIAVVNSAEVSGSPTVSILYGNGDGEFTNASTINVGSGASSIATGDLNSDGRIDLVVGNAGTNSVSVLLNTASGAFQNSATITMGNGPVVRMADLNGDNRLDLITSDSGDGTVSVRLGSGGASFGALTSFAMGNGNFDLQIGDLNGDGRLDMVTADQFDSALSIRLGNGAGSFGSRTTVAASGNIQKIKLADTNADSVLDIISADGMSNTISIWRGSGTGTFGTRTALTTGSNAQGILAFDFDDDGTTDLVTGDEGDATLSVQLGEANQIATASSMSIDTQEGAKDVLSVMSRALNNLSQNRALLGAQQSRLDFALNNNQNMIEALSQARSQILDADMAEAAADFTRNQILTQAGVSVLGQANISLQIVLNLLRF